jgi:hypothetical protein
VLLIPDDVVIIFRQLIREEIDEVAGKIQDNYLGDNSF